MIGRQNVSKFMQVLDRPVSGLSLGAFRIAFGFFLFWATMVPLFYGEDEIKIKFIDTQFHFKHDLFTWVVAWPSLGLAYFHYAVLAISALLVMIGLFTRSALILCFLLFSYIFFVDLTYYLNHYYLVIVFGFMMIFLPTENSLSIDSLRNAKSDDSVPIWSVWSMRCLTEIVLIYAGLVKINEDWLRLEPLGLWLRARANWHFFGDLIYQDWFIALGAYGAIALHLVGAPLLLFKKTRLWAFAAYCFFHLLNSYTFDIGIFPFFTIAATLLFFPPDWPKLFSQWLRDKKDAIRKYYASKHKTTKAVKAPSPIPLIVVAVFLLIQIALPLRPLLYEGNSAWTEEGHRFSWRMMLRSVQAVTARFRVYDPATDTEWWVDPKDYLLKEQLDAVGTEPLNILQFAKYIEKKWQEKGYRDVEVYAYILNSLNGRKPAPFIDSTVDLTEQSWGFAPTTWVLPLNEPFIHWKDRTWR